LLDQIGYVLASADIIEFKRNVEAARAQLTEDAFATAWAQGREIPLEEAVLDAMALSAQEMQKAPGAGSRLPVEPINEREREVLLLIAEGLSNHEISDRLTIALSTVKWHTGNLFGKLGVRSRTQATARAKELHLL
jgi:ATP/maltotriose-dependent transcriptional regulator MalT